MLFLRNFSIFKGYFFGELKICPVMSQLILLASPPDYLERVVVTLRNVGASKKVELKFHFQVILEMLHSNCCHASKILTLGSKCRKLTLLSGNIDIQSIIFTKLGGGAHIWTKAEIWGQKLGIRGKNLT